MSKIGHWDEADRLQVAILRLADPAKSFLYHSCAELHSEDATWQEFKKALKNDLKRANN